MKLIIDISEKTYNAVIDDEWIDSEYIYNIINSIKNNTPLSEELDKIRAEIDTARFIDKDTKLCKNANASGLEVAMQIIDKYKAESELKGENNE